MSGTPTWELFEAISYQGDPPPYILLREGWVENDHTAILEKKDEIASFEFANEWELRKKITNPYEAIFSTSDTKSFPSLALVNPLSRSYFKMVEMSYVADIWGSITTPIVSAHICEGPGGFLQCTVEQGKQRGKLKNSYAMTLKSTRSQIPGWKRSSKFLKKHPEIQLVYGADMTGNILLEANQDSFCETVNGAMLFTADGGFDFSTDYTKQEEHAFQLVLASFLIGLRSLARGGTMIIKLFDIYSPVMLDLILGTAATFDSFLLYKPATSRPCNSERYFIGKGYRGNAKDWIKHLQLAQVNHRETPITRLCCIAPDSPYIGAIKEQIEWQEQLQLESIRKAMYMKKEDIEDYVKDAIQQSMAWCQMFSVPYSV